MSCNTVTQCKAVPECTTTLIIAEAPAYIGDPVYVFIENLGNGHVVRHEGVVNYDGDIEITLTTRLMAGQSYMLWMNDEIETPQDTVAFYVDGTMTETVTFDAFKLYDENYDPMTGLTTKLQLL